MLKSRVGATWRVVDSVTIEGPSLHQFVHRSQEASANQVSVTEPDTPAAETALEQARAEAEALLAAAREQARQLTAEAEQEADQIRAEAEAQGFSKGYQHGMEKGEAEARQAWLERLEQAQAVILGAERERRRLLASARPLLIEVAMEAVRGLLKRELAQKPADVEKMVQELLDYVVDGRHVEVRVHPDDFLQASEAQPRWRLGKPMEWEIVVLPDASISLGGCEVRCTSGRMDARMETKLELLEQVLPQVFDGGRNDD
ncbi:FliH/SctL family protein [Alicyclobacillus herbarius]|uniref:FliH/SctL family protein n=1 Tax=Alicyclobacillus herbarius TaxID=122960 RepID=UPI0005551359|nr:FliH/SctL family protein [Alicyclobacillus herbarius]